MTSTSSRIAWSSRPSIRSTIASRGVPSWLGPIWAAATFIKRGMAVPPCLSLIPHSSRRGKRADRVQHAGARVGAGRTWADDRQIEAGGTVARETIPALGRRAGDRDGVHHRIGDEPSNRVAVATIPRLLDRARLVGKAAVGEQPVVAREESRVERHRGPEGVERLAAARRDRAGDERGDLTRPPPGLRGAARDVLSGAPWRVERQIG